MEYNSFITGASTLTKDIEVKLNRMIYEHRIKGPWGSNDIVVTYPITERTTPRALCGTAEKRRIIGIGTTREANIIRASTMMTTLGAKRMVLLPDITPYAGTRDLVATRLFGDITKMSEDYEKSQSWTRDAMDALMLCITSAVDIATTTNNISTAAAASKTAYSAYRPK